MSEVLPKQLGSRVFGSITIGDIPFRWKYCLPGSEHQMVDVVLTAEFAPEGRLCFQSSTRLNPDYFKGISFGQVQQTVLASLSGIAGYRIDYTMVQADSVKEIAKKKDHDARQKVYAGLSGTATPNMNAVMLIRFSNAAGLGYWTEIQPHPKMMDTWERVQLMELEELLVASFKTTSEEMNSYKQWVSEEFGKLRAEIARKGEEISVANTSLARLKKDMDEMRKEIESRNQEDHDA